MSSAIRSVVNTRLGVLAVAGCVSLVAAVALHREGPRLLVIPVAVAAVPFIARRGRALLLAIAMSLTLPYWQTVGSAQLNVARVTAAIALLGLVGGRTRQRLHIVDIFVAAVVAFNVLSWYLHPKLGIDVRFLYAALIPFMLYLATRLQMSWPLARQTLWTLHLAASVGALTVLYEWRVGSAVFVDPTTYQWRAAANALFRPGGVYGGSPAAAIILGAVLVATLPLLSMERSWRRLLVVAGHLLMLTAIVLTFGRGGWLGLVAGILVYAFVMPLGAPGWMRAIAVLLVSGLVLYFAFPAANTTRVVSQGIIRTDTVQVRQTLWKLSLPLVDDSTTHLLVGRGFDSFFGSQLDPAVAASELVQFGGPNNDYLRALVEDGLIGLLVLLSWFIGSISAGWIGASKLRRGSEERRILAGLTGGLVVCVIGSLAHDTSHNSATLGMMALLTALLVSLVATRSAAQPEAAPESL